MKKIAIIGTGVMGSGIANNFLKKGYDVYVWNRTKDKLQDLLKNGAIELVTPKQGAEIADLVFEVTSDDESSRAVWLGDFGIISGSTDKSILITSATLSVSWVDELSQVCKNKNRTFFDMPITGGRMGAETGTLALLVGGDKNIFETIKPDLTAISTQVFYFGEHGSGSRFKLILNMVQGVHIVTFADALEIAKNQHMDIDAVGHALSERMGATTAMGWRDYNKNLTPANFSISLMDKDLRYVKKLSGIKTPPILDVVLDTFDTAVEKGLGSEDWTILLKRNNDKLTQNNPKLWFKAKRYGFGWTPSSWQGWGILVMYIFADISNVIFANNHSDSISDFLIQFFPQLFILTVFLIIICYTTGEKPRWRWGRKEVESL